MTEPVDVGMYQGEDFEQSLLFFSDVAQTTALVFTNPVMDIRAPRARLATFDTGGTQEGLATIPAAGSLLLTMSWQQTRLIPPGTYPLDIFADVAGKRRAITKVGELQLVVAARNTVDDAP